ncbi:MAG: CBS domain-containing protein [Planctomycetota bacterium]
MELATESLEAFCEDISAMFGVEMECREQEVSTETVAKLKERFKRLVAVNIVDSEGILNGTFQLIFDQEGLFTLGGVMVMLPEKRILANMKDGSADLAESMVDAVGEAGNLLVGAWERIFREEFEDHGHFLQRLPAFVGEPWDNPEEKIGLSGEQEHVFAPYEMRIAPYPAFKCGVIFPKGIFESKSTSDSEDADPVDDDAANEAEAKAPDTEAAAEEAEPEEPQPATQSNAEKAEQQQPAAEEAKSEEPQPATQSNAEKAEQQQPAAEEVEPEEPQPATENNAEEAKAEQPATESDAEEAKPVRPVVEEAPAAKTPDDEVSTSYTPDDESSTTETPTAEAPAAEAADENEQTRSLEAAEDKAVSEEPAEAPESAVDQSEPAPPDASAGQSDAVPETSTAWDAAEEESQEAEPAKEPALGPISEAIKEMARLSVSLAESGTAGPAKEATPDGASQLLGMCAKDIMQNRVVWVDPDDSVQEALTKLQLHDIGYLPPTTRRSGSGSNG